MGENKIHVDVFIPTKNAKQRDPRRKIWLIYRSGAFIMHGYYRLNVTRSASYSKSLLGANPLSKQILI